MDHAGWRSVIVHLPQGLAQPARLVAVYVIGVNASATMHGRIVVKNLHAVVAGTERIDPKIGAHGVRGSGTPGV